MPKKTLRRRQASRKARKVRKSTRRQSGGGYVLKFQVIDNKTKKVSEANITYTMSGNTPEQLTKEFFTEFAKHLSIEHFLKTGNHIEYICLNGTIQIQSNDSTKQATFTRFVLININGNLGIVVNDTSLGTPTQKLLMVNDTSIDFLGIPTPAGNPGGASSGASTSEDNWDDEGVEMENVSGFAGPFKLYIGRLHDDLNAYILAETNDYLEFQTGVNLADVVRTILRYESQQTSKSINRYYVGTGKNRLIVYKIDSIVSNAITIACKSIELRGKNILFFYDNPPTDPTRYNQQPDFEIPMAEAHTYRLALTTNINPYKLSDLQRAAYFPTAPPPVSLVFSNPGFRWTPAPAYSGAAAAAGSGYGSAMTGSLGKPVPASKPIPFRRYVITSHGRPSKARYSPPKGAELHFFTPDGKILQCPNVLQTQVCAGQRDDRVVEVVSSRDETKDYLLSKDLDASWKSGAVDCSSKPKTVVFNLEVYNKPDSEVPLSYVVEQIMKYHEYYYPGELAKIFCLFCR